MAVTVVKDTNSMSGIEVQPLPPPPVRTGGDVEFVKCECCGLTEECTEAYISRVRERNQGRWICGLCAEAVKDEMTRSSERRIGNEEALNRHMSFCKNFRSSMSTPPSNPTEDLISAVKQLLMRSLDSPRTPRPSSGSGSPMAKEGSVCRRSSPLVRSNSFYSTLDG